MEKEVIKKLIKLISESKDKEIYMKILDKISNDLKTGSINMISLWLMINQYEFEEPATKTKVIKILKTHFQMNNLTKIKKILPQIKKTLKQKGGHFPNPPLHTIPENNESSNIAEGEGNIAPGVNGQQEKNGAELNDNKLSIEELKEYYRELYNYLENLFNRKDIEEKIKEKIELILQNLNQDAPNILSIEKKNNNYQKYSNKYEQYLNQYNLIIKAIEFLQKYKKLPKNIEKNKKVKINKLKQNANTIIQSINANAINKLSNILSKLTNLSESIYQIPSSKPRNLQPESTQESSSAQSSESFQEPIYSLVSNVLPNQKKTAVTPVYAAVNRSRSKKTPPPLPERLYKQPTTEKPTEQPSEEELYETLEGVSQPQSCETIEDCKKKDKDYICQNNICILSPNTALTNSTEAIYEVMTPIDLMENKDREEFTRISAFNIERFFQLNENTTPEEFIKIIKYMFVPNMKIRTGKNVTSRVKQTKKYVSQPFTSILRLLTEFSQIGKNARKIFRACLNRVDPNKTNKIIELLTNKFQNALSKKIIITNNNIIGENIKLILTSKNDLECIKSLNFIRNFLRNPDTLKSLKYPYKPINKMSSNLNLKLKSGATGNLKKQINNLKTNYSAKILKKLNKTKLKSPYPLYLGYNNNNRKAKLKKLIEERKLNNNTIMNVYNSIGLNKN